jgi:hypothetical protein
LRSPVISHSSTEVPSAIAVSNPMMRTSST